jgi:hypothetical protein
LRTGSKTPGDEVVYASREEVEACEWDKRARSD